MENKIVLMQKQKISFSHPTRYAVQNRTNRAFKTIRGVLKNTPSFAVGCFAMKRVLNFILGKSYGS